MIVARLPHDFPAAAHIDECNPYWSFSAVRTESARSWGSISAGMVSRAAGTVVWRSDCHRIVYSLTDVQGFIRNDDGPPLNWPLTRDNFSFRPSGVTLESSVEAPVRFIQILQGRDIYDSIISGMVRGGAVDLEPRTGLHDPLVSQIALTIANEADHGFHYPRRGTEHGAGRADLTNYVDPSAIELAPSSGLSRERLQRVRDYIEAHLELDRSRRGGLS